MKTHKDLNVYNLSIDLVAEIYKLTSKYPKEELYGLVSQIRRSAVSIPSNIAEGSSRNYNKEYIQFLYISLGSASELDTQILISYKLNFITEKDYLMFSEKINTISKMIQGLIKSVKK